MQFCQSHWDALRAALESRGLMALVPETGQAAAQALHRELTEGPSIDSFDPLMNAHWAITNNVMRIINPIAVLGHEGCPLCQLNQLHAQDCTDPDCPLPKENGFDRWIEAAADEQVQAWKALSLTKVEDR